MNQSKKACARAAVEAAIILLAEDSDSSSDSDDDVEILVMKMYLKYKAKRRKVLAGNRSIVVDGKQSENNDPTSTEVYEGQIQEDVTSQTKAVVEADSNIELIVLDKTGATVESPMKTSAASSVDPPFQLHVSNIFSFIPEKLTSRILTDQDFRIHFKLSRSSVEDIVRAIKNNRVAGRTGRPMMPPEKAILIFLWFLGTRETYTNISTRFDVPKSVAYAAFAHTCQSVSALKEHHIQWPTGDAAVKVIRGYEADSTSQFPGVMGSLGATHIPISEPKDPNFRNRSDYNSVILQGVCDATGAFIDVFTGWPGSASHAHVWLHSPLHGELQANPDFLPSGTHLLAGEAYPLSQDVMVPFQSTCVLAPQETHFNESLYLKKAVLNQAFARLKHRFERLGYLHVNIVENIKFITLAACVCHNIATREATEWDDEEDPKEDDGLDVPQVDHEEVVVVAIEAMEKRDLLAQQMFASYDVM